MSIVSNQPISSPVLIGREREQAHLHALIDQVRRGQGQVVLLSGEAGIGKSSLAAEGRRQASGQGFLVLQGTCFPTDRSSPYAPLLDLLASSQTQELLSLSTSNADPLARELARLFPGLVDHASEEASLRPIEPEQEKRRLFVALTQFFTGLASKQPVLLIGEDLHWGDEMSLEYLLSLARSSARHPLLMVLTYRNDEIHSELQKFLAQLDRERLAHEICLAPLSRSEVEAVLHAIFDWKSPMPTATLDAIYELTEGNPFFLEEILKSLLLAGALVSGNGTWERWPPNALPIPRSIQAALQLRLDRVSPAARQVVILAAVAGKRFDFTLLQQITGHEEQELLRLMKELIAVQLVVEESEEQFAFRHPLTREAMYSQLLLRERKGMHRMIAETMEQLFVTSRDAHLAELAHHFYEAGMWEKAFSYAQLAGEKAQSLYAPRTAIEHLTHALDAVHQLHVMPPAQIYLARGHAYQTLGEFDRALGDFEHALEISRDAHDGLLEWQSMMALGFLWAARDYTQTGTWFRLASELAERLDDPTLRARSLNRFGNWLANTGQIEKALQAHQEALNIFEQQQDTQGMAESFDLLGPTYGMRGDRVKAVEYIGQAIALFRTMGDSQSLISSLAMRAIQSMPGSSITTFSPLRTRNACVRDAEEALRLARQIDSLLGKSFAEAALAHTLTSFGEVGPALTHAQEALRISSEIEHRQWMISSYFALGNIYLLLLGPDTEALTALQAGLSLARELGSTYWIVTLVAQLGHAYMLSHNLPQAKATLQVVMPREQPPRTVAERHIALAWGELALAQEEPEIALHIAEHMLASVPGLVPGQPAQPIPHLLKLKGEALLALSHMDEAVAALEDAREGAVTRNERPILWMIHRVLGQAYLLLQREVQARQEQALARQIIEELATTIDDTSLHEQFLQRARGLLPQEKPLLPREAVKQSFGGLTAREREVAQLVAQGKTSREIAGLLVVSERTAEGHVNNILGKLGFTSRAQIAAWVVETGLANR
jgi:DNA-binding CsgD family transcriptional regulator/tetratricopeptide (TPR) repeat protein